MRHGGCQPVHHQVQRAANRIRHSQCAATVGNVGELNARRPRKPHHHQVRNRPDARRAIADARAALGRRHKFGKVGVRRILVGHQRIRRAQNICNVGEAFVRVPVQPAPVQSEPTDDALITDTSSV